jgi:metal-responsive CopG/Arc/MetJ family transcriptional regulator
MAKALSLKLKEEIFKEVEEIIQQKHIPRNTYINQALSFYNKLNKKKLLKNQLQYESDLVRQNSLKILEEFEKLEDDIPE